MTQKRSFISNLLRHVSPRSTRARRLARRARRNCLRTEVLEPRIALYSATIDLLPGSDSGYSDSDNITNAPQWQVAVTGVTPGATVQLRLGDTVLASGNAGSESITLIIDSDQVAALAEGEVSLYAIELVDDVESDASAPLVVIKDTIVAPFTSTPPTSAISGHALTYDAQNPEEGTPGAAYSLVGGPTGAAVDTETGLVNGTPTDEQIGDFSFQILLTNAAGNSLAQDVNLTVRPAAVSSFDLNAASDSGYSASDRITNASTWTLDIGGVVDGAEVRIVYAGETISSGIASGSSIAIDVDAAQFPEGSSALVAVQVLNGIGSAPSAPLLVIRDTTAPEGTTNTPPATLVHGEELDFDLEHAEEGTPGFSYALLGAPAGMAIDAATGALSWTPGAADAGTHAFSIVLSDAAGNQFVQSAMISVSPPAPQTADLAETSDSGVLDSDNLTRSNVWTIKVAGVADGATVRLLRDGELVATEVASGTSIDFTLDASAFADGEYFFAAEQVVDGVTSPASLPLTVVRDATPPAEMTNASPLGMIVGAPLEFDFAHDEEGSAGFTYELVNPPVGATIDPSSGLLTWTATSDQISAHSLQVQLTDAAGNEHVQAIDVTVRPAAPQMPDLDDASDSGYSNTDNLTRELAWTITIGGVIDGALVKLYRGDDVVASGIASGTSVALTVDASAFSDGPVELRAEQTVNDVPSPLSEAIAITLDTTQPADLSSPATVSAVAGVPFTYDAEHAEEGAAGFVYALTNAPSGATIDASSGVSFWSPTAADFGSNAFDILLTDAAGNTHVQSITVTVHPSAPAIPDLDLTSDSGYSNSDNLTNHTTWTLLVSGVTIGATVHLRLGGEIVATLTAEDFSVTFTFDASELADGDYILTAEQVVSDVTSPLSDPLSIALDSTPPADLAGAPPTTAIVDVPLVFDAQHAEEGTPGFTYALTSAPAGATIDPVTGEIHWTPTTEQYGVNAFELLLTDGAGNTHTQAFSVLVTPPAPEVPDLSAGSDSGYRDDDNITNATTWTINIGELTDGATIELFLNGASIDSQTVSGDSITFTVDASAFEDGDLAFTAVQTVMGVASPASDALTIVLDRTLPAALTSPLTAGAERGIAFVYDAQHPEEGTPGFTYALTTAPASATMDPLTGEIHWTPTSEPYGVQEFVILLTDAAGNTHTQTLSVTLTPPAPQTPDLSDGSDSGYSTSDNITNVSTWNVSIGGLIVGATVRVYIDGALLDTFVADDVTHAFVVDVSSFADGPYAFTANQTADSVTSPVSGALTVTKDTTPPANITNLPPTSAPTHQDFVFDAQHHEEGMAGFTYALTAAPAGATIDPVTGEIRWTPVSSQLGLNDFTLTLTDVAGNQTTQSFQVQVQPNAPQTPDLTAESDSGSSATDNITRATSWTITVGDLFVGATVRLLLDGVVVATLTADANEMTFTVDAASLADGGHSITAEQEVDGIASPVSTPLTIVKDTTPPGDLSNTPPTTAFIGQELVFDAEHAEEGDVEFSYSLTSGPTGATLDPLTGELRWTPDTNQVGVNAFELQLTDAAGNTHTQSFSITIRPAAPGIPDLDAASDSGVSTADNVTNASNWTIVVSGVLAGATVELWRDGVVVDTLTASGASVTFSIAASGLSEGAHTFTTKQSFAGAESDLSAALTVTKDTTPPPDFTSTPPVSATVNQQLTYDAQNPEEGASGFFYSLINSPAGAIIDPNTGVLTWTPAANQTGTHSFQIQVTDAAGNTRTQQITMTVQGEGPAAPAGIDLLDISDSGFSQTDNLTNARTWQLLVSGVASGATVNILRNGVVVGTAVATGSSVVVFVRNTDAFPDGPVTLTAVQVVGGQTSAASPEIIITKDTTPPESITSLPPDTIIAGQTLTYDAQHPSEGQAGCLYSLVNAPAGVSINSATGVLTWTPTTAQVGAYAFGIQLTDPAGNSALQNINLAVVTSQEQIVRFTIFVVDLQGNEITQVQEGDEFEIQVSARDARANPAGMFSAYLDLLYDPQLVQVAGNIEWGPSFPNARSGNTATPGLVDEVGGTGSLSGTPGDVLVFKLRFRALAGGFASFVTNPADDSVLHPVLVFNVGAAIPNEQVTQAAGGVSIASGIGAAPDAFTVQEDSQNNVLDVLDNDTLPATSTGTLTLASVTQPTTGGTVSISLDGLHLLFTPAPNFFGSVSFTYTISDGQGFTDTATVQLTVSNVNDNPTANNDTFSVNFNSDTTTLNVLANDAFAPDPQETLTITNVSAGSAGGTITIGASGGNLQYKPAAGFVGAETFTYTISDGHGGTATATVTVNVTAVGGNPTAANDSVTFGKNAGPQVINVLANDTAPSGQTLTITSVTQGSQGGLIEIINGGTAIRYTATANFLGTETFTYTISNGQGGTSTATVTVNVQDFIASDISGFVYIDANNSGLKDGQEIGLGGVTITLTGTSTAGSAVNLTTVSRADGSYSFQNVPPGTYTLVEAPLGFMIDGADTLGSHGGTMLNDRFTVTFGQNSHLAGYNFGERGREARFVNMRDFLTSTPVENVMAAFNAGGALTWHMLGKGWDGVSALSATLNSNRTQLTLTMTDTSGAQFTATVSTSDRTRVQILGNESAGMLLRLVGARNSFNFTPVTSNLAASNANNTAGDDASGEPPFAAFYSISPVSTYSAPSQSALQGASSSWSTSSNDALASPLPDNAVGAALALQSSSELPTFANGQSYFPLDAYLTTSGDPLPAQLPIEASPTTFVGGQASEESQDESRDDAEDVFAGWKLDVLIASLVESADKSDAAVDGDEPSSCDSEPVQTTDDPPEAHAATANAVEHVFSEWESAEVSSPSA